MEKSPDLGPIADVVSVTNFKVQHQTVDASAAVFQRGTAADLANGKLMRIDRALASGKVIATRVQFPGP